MYTFRFHSRYDHRSRRITDVEIYGGDEKIASASVIRHANDPDNKAVAQKYAVSKALQGISSRYRRGLIWESFFNSSNRARQLKK